MTIGTNSIKSMEIDEETRKPRRNIENLSKSEEIDEKE